MCVRACLSCVVRVCAESVCVCGMCVLCVICCGVVKCGVVVCVVLRIQATACLSGLVPTGKPSMTKNSSSSRAHLALNSGTSGGARKMLHFTSKKTILNVIRAACRNNVQISMCEPSREATSGTGFTVT